MYLSPDQRFLSPRLVDSKVDPKEADEAEATRTSAQLNSYIRTHRNPVAGNSNEPVTFSLFSDFQCPYCKQQTEVLLKDVLPALPDQGAHSLAALPRSFPCLGAPCG